MHTVILFELAKLVQIGNKTVVESIFILCVKEQEKCKTLMILCCTHSGFFWVYILQVRIFLSLCPDGLIL